jgi:hypothetical protein
MKKALRRKLTLSRETVTALETRSLDELAAAGLDTRYDCSSACFAATNRDYAC